MDSLGFVGYHSIYNSDRNNPFQYSYNYNRLCFYLVIPSSVEHYWKFYYDKGKFYYTVNFGSTYNPIEEELSLESMILLYRK